MRQPVHPTHNRVSGPPKASQTQLGEERETQGKPTAYQLSRRNPRVPIRNVRVATHLHPVSRARPRPDLVYLSFWPAESSPDRHPKCLNNGCARGNVTRQDPILQCGRPFGQQPFTRPFLRARPMAAEQESSRAGPCLHHAHSLAGCLSDVDTPTTKST